MTRSKIRECIFCILFRSDFHKKEEMAEQCRLYLNDIENVSEEDYNYISNKVNNIVNSIDKIDDVLNQVSVGWKTTRMAKSDLTVLRLAYYEMKNETDIPDKVAVNEAVNLAKKYGTDNSQAFVNGILAKLI